MPDVHNLSAQMCGQCGRIYVCLCDTMCWLESALPSLRAATTLDVNVRVHACAHMHANVRVPVLSNGHVNANLNAEVNDNAHVMGR